MRRSRSSPAEAATACGAQLMVATWPWRQRRLQAWVVLLACAPLLATLLSSASPQRSTASPLQTAQGTPVTTTPPTVPGPSWSVQATPNPSGDWGPGSLDRLNGVSCVSSSFCMASGYFVAKPAKPGVFVGAALFERWDGSDWSVVPNPGGTANAEMNSISCTDEDFCMSVGLNLQKKPPIESWNGSEWSSLPSPVPAGDIGVNLHGVSCTSPTACVAVGSAGVKPVNEPVAGEGLAGTTIIESWDGSSWSVVPSPSPGAWTNGLTSVSCTTDGGSLCVAVGSVQNSVSSASHAIIEVDQGGTWSLAAEVDKVPTNASGFNGVSCSSATQCVVVGYYDDNHFDFLLDDNWDGQSWTIVPSPTSVAYGMGVSCLAATNCTEVSPTGKAFVWGGTSWTSVPTPTKTSSSGQVEQDLNAISCAPGLCVAVGDYVEQGSTWTYVEQGCGAVATSGTSSSQVKTALFLASTGPPAGGGCPLKVFVKVLGPIHSGLAVDDQFASDGPVNFTVPTYGGHNGTAYAGPLEPGQRCLSGCVNVLVTVIDPATNKPLKGAEVTVSVDPLVNTGIGADFARLYNNNEFLCLQSDEAPGVPQSPCSGTGLSGLTTDKKGHVYLIYWAPGVVNTAGTTLFVSAKYDTCGHGPCAMKTGTAPSTTLTVQPHIIYQHTGVLPGAEVALLVKFAQEPNHFVADVALDQYAEHLLEHALTTLELFEEHAASIAGGAGLAVSTIVQTFEALSKLGDQRGLIATLLEPTALDLSTLGLGDEPYAAKVSVDPSPYFMGQILDGLGDITSPLLPIPKTVGPSGILWTDAQALSESQKHWRLGAAAPPESINLKVYEISHCDQSYAVCGPGYKSLLPKSTLSGHRGIVAQLCFYFRGSDGLPGFNWSDHFCEPQYAAPYWVVSQPGRS
jgi:hypothetical protein